MVAAEAPETFGLIDIFMVMTQARSDIERLYETSVAALNAKDLPGLADVFTGDAIQLPPKGPPLEGWEAIRSSLEDELRGLRLIANLEIVEAVSAGDWAFARGRYRNQVFTEESGVPTVITGNWLDILRRRSGGSWRIARSTWTVDKSPHNR